MTNQFHAVHVRHVEIADDDVDMCPRLGQQGQRRLAICRLGDGRRAKLSEQHVERIALEGMVVDDKKRQPGSWLIIRSIGSGGVKTQAGDCPD